MRKHFLASNHSPLMLSVASKVVNVSIQHSKRRGAPAFRTALVISVDFVRALFLEASSAALRTSFVQSGALAPY